jgi:TrmH family RNA methyltransferase
MNPIRFVLVRPGNGGNVGAAARALKNMGAGALWLVDPRPFDAVEAERLAHGATDVLARARRVSTLAEAVGDCRWIVGTTRRAGQKRVAAWTPRAWAEAAHASPERRPVAIVFGPEEDGLGGAELAWCHDIVRIPAHPSQPSLNLAQAVLVLAYEWFIANPRREAAPAPVSDEARATELAGLYAHLESMLFGVGYVRPHTAPHRMRVLRGILGRARLRPDEVRLLRGICRQVLWAVETPEPRPRAPAPARARPGRAKGRPRPPV